MHVFLPGDQGLVAVAREEEPAVGRVAELVDHDPGQLECRGNPVRFAGRLIQPCQAVDQVGVVVEIGVELGLIVLVSVEQAAVLTSHAFENETGRPCVRRRGIARP